MLDVLRGAYDLHVHSAPDVVKRRFSDIELAKRYAAAGFKGFAIKNHQLCTAGRAALVREAVPECRAVGSITLNDACGGLNPMAVEMAARMGAKIVWFPTVDSQNQQDFLNRTHAAAPYGAVADNKTLKRERIRILEENDMLKESAHQILDVIKAHDMVLATGHISVHESQVLVREASKLGIRKIVVTHVDFPATLMPLEMQKECVSCGALLEHNYLQIATGEADLDLAVSQIKEIGPEHFIICSDGGQTTSVPPDEAVENYARALLNAGIAENEVRRIFVENTAALVG
ncbi:MAG: DUF6282 family protein [Pyramidobacter sp.]|jgi:hypothetical protein